MQALEFTRALKEITQQLKVQELVSLLEPLLTPGVNAQITEEAKNRFSLLLFSSNAGYEQLKGQAVIRSILQKLNADEFYEPSRLRGMLSTISGANQTNQIYGNAEAFAQFYSFRELLRSFLRIEITCRQVLEEEKIGQLELSDGIVELELIEYADDVGISPKRLEVFASSIAKLHMHLARVHGVEDKLTFKYFDSGSGFLVGILCGKNIADTMNTLLTQWWDRIRFWRYDTFEKKIGAVAKTLTVVETVQQQVQKGIITQEEGENLKIRIFHEVENLTGIGATVPLEENATIDQRQLLTENS